MLRLLPLLLTLLSCSSPKTNELVKDPINQTTATKHQASEQESEPDCVFNNDYKGLTESYLNELKVTDYTWDDSLKQALIARDQDTVFYTVGGCTHMNFMAGIKLTRDTHLLTDSAFFIGKALELAIEFKFDQIESQIRAGKIKKADHEDDTNWYMIEDTDYEDNLIFNGVEILTVANGRVVIISQYFN